MNFEQNCQKIISYKQIVVIICAKCGYIPAKLYQIKFDVINRFQQIYKNSCSKCGGKLIITTEKNTSTENPVLVLYYVRK